MTALFVILTIIALYFMPFTNAIIKKHRQLWAIFYLNLFLGWTFIGWVVAYIWSEVKEK